MKKTLLVLVYLYFVTCATLYASDWKIVQWNTNTGVLNIDISTGLTNVTLQIVTGNGASTTEGITITNNTPFRVYQAGGGNSIEFVFITPDKRPRISAGFESAFGSIEWNGEFWDYIGGIDLSNNTLTNAIYYGDGAGITNVTASRTQRTETSTYTVDAEDDAILCNGTFTVTLTAVATSSNAAFSVKNIGTGVITVDGNAAETIDGRATYILSTQYQNVNVICNGSVWYVL